MYIFDISTIHRATLHPRPFFTIKKGLLPPCIYSNPRSSVLSHGYLSLTKFVRKNIASHLDLLKFCVPTHGCKDIQMVSLERDLDIAIVHWIKVFSCKC